jgi:phosphate transport system substrate-binding protein
MMLTLRKSPARRVAALASALWIVVAASALKGSAAEALELHGAGSTFIAPLMDGWINYFENSQPDINIRYDAIGSGEGAARFEAGAVNFAASDNHLSAADVAKVERGVIQLPSAAGMIVLAYNLPGVKGRLNLPQDVYADIFLGKIRTWDDPRIRAANPNLHLPPIGIAIIGRRDASGTTYALTDHLAAISKEWAAKPGVGRVVEWPHIAMLARGNEGVASRIRIAQGAIGYVEYGFALRLGLPMAALGNKDGQFVAPSPQSGAAALAPASNVALDVLDEGAVNPSGAKAYPIVTYSWLLFHQTYPKEQAAGVASFLDFALDEGQSYAPYFGYLPLPAPVIERAKAALAQFRSANELAAAPAREVPVTDGSAAKTSTETGAALRDAPPPSQAPSNTYTVAGNESLQSIALKLYRNSALWRDIAAANPGVDLRRLHAGQVIKLPTSGLGDRAP